MSAPTTEFTGEAFPREGGVLCAELRRDVNDLDFDVALHIVFDTKAAQDAYQEAPRHEQTHRPSVQLEKEVMVTNQELAEVQGDSPVHKVQEHEPAAVLLLDADRQLVGKAADGLAWP